MADQFLEESLPVSVRMGASYADEHDVVISESANGNEYRTLRSASPRRTFTVSFVGQNADLWNSLIALYHRAHGTYAGFRVRHLDDHSTNGHTLAPTAADQDLLLVSAGVYQLVTEYGAGGTPLSIGLPYRVIHKPVAGSVRVSVSGVEIGAGLAVDSTTGRVTFDANKTASITGISKAPNAVISCTNTFAIGETVYITGVSGMTDVNGKRVTIIANTGSSITVDLNTTEYATWTSGGTLNTRPQTGEPVKAGCLFDIPVRFATAIDIAHISRQHRETSQIDLVELLNP